MTYPLRRSRKLLTSDADLQERLLERSTHSITKEGLNHHQATLVDPPATLEGRLAILVDHQETLEVAGALAAAAVGIWESQIQALLCTGVLLETCHRPLHL